MKELPGMTVNQVQLLRESLVALAPRADELSAYFYRRLFRLDPTLRLLFRRDMTRQHHKWVATLNAIFDDLQEPQDLIDAARHLGRRHLQYGVHRDDYRLAGEALTWAVEQVLTTAFTPELREAWTAGYAYLAYFMQEAAAGDAKPTGL